MLAAGAGLKLSDFLGVFILILTGFCQEINGKSFLFWHLSVRYNVSFIKTIRISMPHRLNVFLSHFFMKFYFLAFKKLNKKDSLDQDNCNFFLPVCFKHPILQFI